MKSNLLLVSLCLATLSAQAQWVQTNGPYAGNIAALAVSGSDIYAGAYGDVFKSADSGTTWSKTGPLQGTSGTVAALVVSGSNIFAGFSEGVNTGIFRSTDNGATWSLANTGLPAFARVFSLLIVGSNIFAGTANGVFLSVNNGGNWTIASTGLGTGFSYVRSLVTSGPNIFAATDGEGVFRSSNNGTSWTAINGGLTNLAVHSLVISGTNIFAGVGGGGVFLSTNNGTSWASVSVGLPNETVNALAVSGSNLFAGTSKGYGIFRSSNNGTTWTPVNTGLTNLYFVQALAVSGTNILAGLAFGGICLSTDNGTHWAEKSVGLPYAPVVALSAEGANILAGTYGNGVSLSIDNGESWSSINEGLTNTDEFPEAKPVLATSTGFFTRTKGTGLVRSTDNGATWSDLNSGLHPVTLSAFGSTIFAGYGGGVSLSTNNGTNWTASNSGLPGSSSIEVSVFAMNGSNLFAGTTQGVYLSMNNGTSWVAVNTGIPGSTVINSIAVSGLYVFAGSNVGVFASANNGTSWTAVNTGLTDVQISALAATSTEIYAGTTGGKVFVTSNNGTSWTLTDLPINGQVSALSATANNIFAANLAGVWRRPLITCMPAQPGVISGNTTACLGSSPTYTIAAVPDATGYTWTLPAGWTGTSTTTSITPTAGTTGGQIFVTADNGCGSSQPRILVVTGIPSQPGSIGGNADICSGSANVYGISVVAGATSYSWTLPAGWTGASTSTSINVTSSANAGNIQVTANNTCGSSIAQTLAITVNSNIPPTPGPISGDADFCQGSGPYSVSPVAGATSYTWTVPAAWYVGAPSTTESLYVSNRSGNGIVSVAANNGCGSSTAQTLIVTPIPDLNPGPVSGNESICPGSSNTYSIATVPGATSYEWFLPTGWTGTSSNTSINATAGGGSGTVWVSAQNICGGSSSTIFVTVALPAKPTITVDMTNQESPVLTSSDGDSYEWFKDGVPVGTSQTFVVTEPGVYTVRVTNTGCAAVDSDPLPMIITGYLENQETSSMQVFPNPVSECLTITLGCFHEDAPVSISIINMQGCVMHVLTGSGKHEVLVDVRHYPPGNYIIAAEQYSQRAYRLFIRSDK